MTTTFTDQRALLDDADTDDWTGTDGLDTSAPTPVEASGCLGLIVSTETQEAYDTITSDDWSAGGTFFAWGRAYGAMDTLSAGGIQMIIGDGTNREGYHVGGSDVTGFRHFDGPVEWACFVMDPANKPASSTNFAGSEASLDESAVTQVGMAFKTLAKSVGGSRNCHIDIMRWADIGVGVTFTGGTTSGAAGSMSEAAVLDRAITTLAALGIVHELASGVFGIQGNIILGDSTSSSDQYWEESNATYAWEDRGLSTDNYYRFALIGSSTATNCEFSFTACTFVVPSAASASFDGNGADITVANLLGCTLIGFDQGIETSDDTGDDWTNCSYIANASVTTNGCDLSGSSLSQYVGAANTSMLIHNIDVDPNGKLDNLTFTKTSGTAHHAIEFGTAISDAADFTLTGCDFGTDFSATEDGSVGDETFHFKDTTGSITLNLVGCSGNKGYRTEGVTVTIVDAPVTTQITVTDAETPPVAISGARVFLEASDGTGPLPYQESVSITQTAGTATVTHTAHGIPDGTNVVIRGATQNGYNKVGIITVNNANEYTYAVDSGTVSPATGSPVASGVLISGTTNGSGIITDVRTLASDQPFTGTVRKSSGSPYYQPSRINDTTDSVNGKSVTVALLSDE